MWVSFHLFCFALLQKNLKKLEVLYVVTSLLVPVPIALAPVVTSSYNVSPFHSYCFIYNNGQNIELIERLVLWDVPAMAILVVASLAMVVMVIIIVKELCLKLKYQPITDGDSFWKAFKELLPLVAFPILFFIFQVPGLINDLVISTDNQTALGIAMLFTSLWSLSSGVTLIAHLSVMDCLENSKKLQKKRKWKPVLSR